MPGAGGRLPAGGAESGLCVEYGPLLPKRQSRLSAHVFRVRDTAWRTNGGMKFTLKDDSNTSCTMQHCLRCLAALPLHVYED